MTLDMKPPVSVSGIFTAGRLGFSDFLQRKKVVGMYGDTIIDFMIDHGELGGALQLIHKQQS